MAPLERAARALAEFRGADPDALEPGNTPYSDDREIVDGRCRNGEPGFFVWRLYEAQARAVLQAIREPSDDQLIEAQRAMFGSTHSAPPSSALTIGFQAMIDAALSELPTPRAWSSKE